MKYAAALAVVLLIAGVALAPTASAQRPARPVAPPARPVVVAPPVLTQPRLNPPTLVVPRVAVPAAPRVVIPPPVRAESLGDGGGGDDDGDGVSNAYDCNDGNASVYPGAPEYGDGYDTDCDGRDN